MAGRQLTLLQCCSSESDSHDGPGTAGTKRVRLSPGTEDPSCLDADSEPCLFCESDEPMSSSYHFPRNQTNNITFGNPTGPTTLVINSSPAQAAATSQSACVNSPGDIASTPAFPRVQPTGLKYPITQW